MAIIYTYPVKATPVDNDLILISDSADSNKTKQVKVSSLPGGSSSGVSSFNTLTGAVTITGGTNVTLNPVGNNIEIIAASTPTQPGNPSASVQYNDGAGAFAGSANLTFSTNTLTLTDTLDIKGDGTNPGTLNLYCENTTTPHAVSILGPVHTGATPYSIRLPKEIATQSVYSSGGRILESDASGALQWIVTPTGGSGAVNQVTAGGVIPASSGAPLIVTPSTGNVVVTSARYAGGSNEGHVPLGGSNTTFLRGDATWVTPTNSTDITLTTTGTSGASTWNGTTLNIPQYSGGGISFSGSTANGIATYSSATTANVSSNLTIDNTNKKLSIGSTYSIQDLSGAFNIGSLSSTQNQETISFYTNGSEKVKIDEDGRLVSSVGTAANPNLKFGTGNDGIYGTSNTVQIVTNGTSKISISDGNAADIQMNDLVEFGFGLRFGATGETLSSYEEGTWTPVMFQSSSPSVTATGYYIKIGKKVTAFFTLVCTAGGSAEISNARISGLPFNAYSGNGYKAGVSIAENTANASNQKYIAGAPGGATTLDLKVFTSGTDYQYAQGRWPNSQGNFTVSGSYTYHAQS